MDGRNRCEGPGSWSPAAAILSASSLRLPAGGLLDHVPDRVFDQSNIDAYKAELIEELERVRDFLVLHYCASRRDDTPVWRDVRAAKLPDSLTNRIALYRGTGRIGSRPGEMFSDLSWFYIFEGLGIRPASLDPLIDSEGFARALPLMQFLRLGIEREVRAARTHDSYFVDGQQAAISVVASHAVIESPQPQGRPAER